MKKNVISYSLWGNIPMYTVGAIRNIQQAKELYPGWECWFYVDDSVDTQVIENIKNEGGIVKNVKSIDSFHGMFWRFEAASNPDVDIMLSRDTDSRLSNRERLAVEEWLSSDKDFHIMRDHPYHTVPILGGMWGCRNGILSNVSELISNWTTFGHKGCDQDFLGKMVYPTIKDRSMEHDDFFKFSGNERRFPTTRQDYEFVGDVFNEHDVREEYWKILKSYIG